MLIDVCSVSKAPHLDREMRGATVAAVTDVTGITFFARGLQRVDHFAFSQFRFRTTVQLHIVEPIGFESLQTTLDAFQDGVVRPVRAALHSVGMTALGEEIKFLAAIADRLADQFFAVVITFCGVDHVKPASSALFSNSATASADARS